MRTETALEPAQVVAAFERGELVLPSGNHENHVYLAWCYLRTRSLVDAFARLPRSLRRFAEADGSGDKYNATLTIAYVLTIYERMRQDAGADWESFRTANSDLFRWPEGPIYDLYTPEVLNSEAAKQDLIPPDRPLGR